MPAFYVSLPENDALNLEEFADAILDWYGSAAELSYGKGVARMQQTLIDRGFLEGEADGNFGPATREAVMDLQRYSKLEVTGAVDHRTLLNIYYNTNLYSNVNLSSYAPDFDANIQDLASSDNWGSNLPSVSEITGTDPLDMSSIRPSQISGLPDINSVDVPSISDFSPDIPSTPVSGLPDKD